MTAAVVATPSRDRPATGALLVAGIVLATLTEAIASTVLSLGRGDIIGDTYATPDEFAWLDIGYTALKLIGFMAAPWLMNRVNPRSLIIGSTLVMGTACGIAAITARLDLLVALRMIQGFSGGTLLVAGQAIIFLRLSAIPPTDPSSPVCDGVGRRSRDDRPGSPGVVARQPVLDMDLLQRRSGGAGGCRTPADRGRPEARSRPRAVRLTGSASR